MTRYMPKVGTRGLDMMYRTATMQVNLDFAAEADMVQEAARLARAAADRDGALRQLALHRRQAERLPVDAHRDLARHRQRPHRHAAVRVRGRLRLRALCRLGARRADVFRLARRRPTTTSPAPRSATFSPASLAALPGERRDALRLGEPRLDAVPRGAPQALSGDARRRCRAAGAHRRALRLLDRPPLRRAAARRRLGAGQGWTAEERQALRDAVPQQALKAKVAGRGARDVARDALALAARA